MIKTIYINDIPIITDNENTTLKQFYDYIKTEIYPTLSEQDTKSVKTQMKNKSENICLYGRDKDMRAYLTD